MGDVLPPTSGRHGGEQEHEQDMTQLGNLVVTENTGPLYPDLPRSSIELQSEEQIANLSAVAAAVEPETQVENPVSFEPPFPALEYKMSEELFRAAKKATPGTPESYWSYSLYRGPGEDGPDRKPKVHYCRSKHTAEQVCQRYFAEEKLLGFDLEWAADSSKSSGPRRNVSLIQLASPSRIALLHVALFSKGDDLVTPTFKKIMENPDITKVGVWIKGDATRLKTHLGIESRGLIELSHLYRLVTYSRTREFSNINKRLIPLATQVEQYLRLPMFKGQDVRSSDWTKPLHFNQVTCKPVCRSSFWFITHVSQILPQMPMPVFIFMPH
jgi:exonuclease 3'-5' domain-containing protein 2